MYIITKFYYEINILLYSNQIDNQTNQTLNARNIKYI